MQLAPWCLALIAVSACFPQATAIPVSPRSEEAASARAASPRPVGLGSSNQSSTLSRATPNSLAAPMGYFGPSYGDPPATIFNWQLSWDEDRLRSECKSLGGSFDWYRSARGFSWSCDAAQNQAPKATGLSCGEPPVVCSLMVEGSLTSREALGLAREWQRRFGAPTKSELNGCQPQDFPTGSLYLRWQANGIFWDASFDCAGDRAKYSLIILNQISLPPPQ
jgi:hypothetical protein